MPGTELGRAEPGYAELRTPAGTRQHSPWIPCWVGALILLTATVAAGDPLVRELAAFELVRHESPSLVVSQSACAQSALVFVVMAPGRHDAQTRLLYGEPGSELPVPQLGRTDLEGGGIGIWGMDILGATEATLNVRLVNPPTPSALLTVLQIEQASTRDAITHAWQGVPGATARDIAPGSAGAIWLNAVLARRPAGGKLFRPSEPIWAQSLGRRTHLHGVSVTRGFPTWRSDPADLTGAWLAIALTTPSGP